MHEILFRRNFFALQVFNTVGKLHLAALLRICRRPGIQFQLTCFNRSGTERVEGIERFRLGAHGEAQPTRHTLHL